MSETEATGEVEAEDIELWYPNVDRFLHEFLLPSWRHTPGAKWCRKWYLHAEAVSRLDALWRAYEAMRVGDPTGMAVWWRDYADPIMAALTSENGTFMSCDHRMDTHHPMPQWVASHAPAVTVPDEGVLRPKANADIVN
ncbi:MAG: DUF4913 domain-containing protein [Brevibacterium aurantiacum]|uniref:DUF4913 domain-containing protein n=1 Tax=Brachybacterium alimentarium TaxID=47845 RepID=UPI000DF15595|nr:DUF4913 domain-containing protein [Brachybacterium alimentarium]MDN6301726.1 DUF4913 domain-containing protein [Brachybacterium sp.]MDN6371477.1 DUF4913 domain-containing protein [Brevibacterium aurantiacum]RCS68770.1 DUF4913 domain-containing protein [Brachybacterium alimentarium]